MEIPKTFQRFTVEVTMTGWYTLPNRKSQNGLILLTKQFPLTWGDMSSLANSLDAKLPVENRFPSPKAEG
jgi:hypothetical protein